MAVYAWADRPNLNKNEHWKLEMDGLDIPKKIPALKEKAFADIDPADVERLKWAGIYAQRPKDGHFLVRVKLPSGRLTSDQARVLAAISHEYGQDSIQITIRQAIQIHNITLRDAEDILARIHAAGLSSAEACGDVPRTVLGNPLMGIDPEELVDTTPIVEEVYSFLQGNRDFSNLPRKFKVSISANPHDAGFARINDAAFVPAEKDGVKGFHIYVGGGLSAEPRLAKKLPFFLKPEEVKPAVKAVAEIFRDYGYREKRGHARLKYLVEDWGVEKFSEVFEKHFGRSLEKGGEEVQLPWNRGVFHGIHPQKQAGLYYAGLNVPEGHLTAPALAELARLADKYGDGNLRTTNSQNVLLINLREDGLEALKKEPIFKDYPLEPGFFTGHATACTGNAYCNWAPVETKERLQDLVTRLEKEFPDLDLPLRVNLTGCFHSCAHPQIADIGLTGGRARVDGEQRDVFSVMLGGSLGPDAAYSEPLKGKVADTKLYDFVAALVTHYFDVRQPGEYFYQTVRRTGKDGWQKILDSYAI